MTSGYSAPVDSYRSRFEELFDFRAVVFDLDGTLYDDREYLRACDDAVLRYIVRELRIPAETATTTLSRVLAAKGRGRHLDNLVEALGLSSDVVPNLLQASRAVEPPLALYAWVPALLADLSSRAIDTWILTNGNIVQQEKKVRLLGLGRLLPATRVVYANGILPKPAPDALLGILEMSGLDPARVAMVGDNAVDRLCAEQCDVRYFDIHEILGCPRNRSGEDGPEGYDFTLRTSGGGGS